MGLSLRSFLYHVAIETTGLKIAFAGRGLGGGLMHRQKQMRGRTWRPRENRCLRSSAAVVSREFEWVRLAV